MASPKEDCEALLNTFFGFAEDLLRRHGEFFPFGATARIGEEPKMVAVDVGAENPASQDLIDNLIEVFRDDAQNGAIDVTALYFDARVKNPETGHVGDAICVRLDHREDYSVLVYFPYQIKRRGLLRKRVVEIFEPIGEDGQNEIF